VATERRLGICERLRRRAFSLNVLLLSVSLSAVVLLAAGSSGGRLMGEEAEGEEDGELVGKPQA